MSASDGDSSSADESMVSPGSADESMVSPGCEASAGDSGSETDASDSDTDESMPSLCDASSKSDSGSEAGDGAITSTSWQTALRECSRSLRPGLLRVLLPCAGWDAPCQALQHMKIPFVVAGAWEIDENCGMILKKVHGIKPHEKLPSQFHLGRAGDVTKVKVRSLPDADLLVAGPPCPPFSSIGKGGLFSDPRSDVFMAILRWIRHLAGKSLRCFVLENVMGMLRRSKDGGQSPADRVMQKLRSTLGDWHIECRRMDSACTGQHRNRIYIVGVRCTIPASSVLLPAPRLPQQTLADIVYRNVPNTPLSELSAGQRSNLKKYMLALAGEAKGMKGRIVALEIDRNPDKKWGARVARNGLCMCLRSGHDRIFLLSLGEASPRVRRLLTPAEGALLQGMRPDIFPKAFLRRHAFRGLGNAMTVPVVGQAVWIGLMGAQGTYAGSDDLGESSDSATSSSAERSVPHSEDEGSSEDASSSS